LTLTYELDLDMVKMSHRAVRAKWHRSEVISFHSYRANLQRQTHSWPTAALRPQTAWS